LAVADVKTYQYESGVGLASIRVHCFREARLNYAVTVQLGRITDISDISSFPSVHHTKAMLPLSDPAPREYSFEHISPLW
jgi:hypothetical protein